MDLVVPSGNAAYLKNFKRFTFHMLKHDIFKSGALLSRGFLLDLSRIVRNEAAGVEITTSF